MALIEENRTGGRPVSSQRRARILLGASCRAFLVENVISCVRHERLMSKVQRRKAVRRRRLSSERPDALNERGFRQPVTARWSHPSSSVLVDIQENPGNRILANNDRIYQSSPDDARISGILPAYACDAVLVRIWAGEMGDDLLAFIVEQIGLRREQRKGDA